MKKIIIIAVVVLLLGGGAGGYFLLSGDEPSADAALGADAALEEGAEAIEEVVAEEDPVYLALNPAFVVNFDHKGRTRYLQLSLQIMSYDQEAVDKVMLNMPAVRNNLIMLFSGQDFDTLSSIEGKENLRQEVRKTIQEAVRQDAGHEINEVYFTGFVMQ
ncbi:MAG: flagellar FliL protein [Halieaceae bacterium]|jgi:flagellar FliL protein